MKNSKKQITKITHKNIKYAQTSNKESHNFNLDIILLTLCNPYNIYILEKILCIFLVFAQTFAGVFLEEKTLRKIYTKNIILLEPKSKCNFAEVLNLHTKED